MTIVRNLILLNFLALDLVGRMQSISMLSKSIMVETNNNKTSYLQFIYSQIKSNPMKIVRSMEENIGNHGYIGTSILQIYRIYRRYIGYIEDISADILEKNIGA